MGIFTGLVVLKPITNQRRYDQTYNQIIQYLNLHSDQVKLQIQPGRYLAVQALYGSDQAYFPPVASNLHTAFFRIYKGENPPQDVKQFGAILWECLNILKENFPSKIELNSHSMELCRPNFVQLESSELLRRQVSCIVSRKQDLSMLHLEQMEELWYVLYQTVKSYDIKGVIICLDILESNIHCPALVFKTVKTQDLRLLESLTNDQQENLNSLQYPGLTDKARAVSMAILKKILLKHPEKATDCPSVRNLAHQDAPRALSERKYQQPSSLNAFMFQLAQTVNIDRVTFLLSSINKHDMVEELMSLNWTEKLVVVLDRYLEGIYSSDQDVIRYGKFQTELLVSTIAVSRSSETFLWLLACSFFQKFFKMVEESCMLAYNCIVNKDTEESQLIFFIEKSLELAELSVSQKFCQYLGGIQEALRGIDKRLVGLTQSGDRDMPAPQDPAELKLISQELYEVKGKVAGLLLKIEAILGFQESFDEKYDRFFRNSV